MSSVDTNTARRLVLIEDFLPRAQAEALRRHAVQRWDDQEMERADRFVWDWWHVPNRFTYLRTFARAFFPRALHQELVDALRAWGRERLGCGAITEPWLSCYVEGCRQELHSDGDEGPWSFVLSLTDWSTRTYTGGETLFAPDGATVAETVEPHFDRLLVFDSRIPHGVRAVQGCLDPRDARLVVHGWFRRPRAGVESGRPAPGALAAAVQALREVADDAAQRNGGVAVFRVDIAADGGVRSAELLSDTVDDAALLDRARDRLGALRLPAAEPARLLLPLDLSPRPQP